MKPNHTHIATWNSAEITLPLALALMAMLCAVTPRCQAQAQTNIIYTFSGSADGSIGDTAFTNAMFKIRVLADTNAVATNTSIPDYTVLQGPALSASIEVAGVGVATFTDATGMFVNQTFGSLGWGIPGVADLMDVSDPDFDVYGLTSPFPPDFFPGPPLYFNLDDLASTLGPVTLSSVEDVTFTVAFTFPALTMALDGDSSVLEWSTNSPGYQLQSADTVSGTPSWTTLTNVPNINGAQYALTNLNSAASLFYRLQN